LGSSSERSLDSSSLSSGPSRKRCRSPTTSIPLPTHVLRSITPTPTDLLPPRKRFRDSYSPEDSGEEHMEVDTTDVEAVADVGISEGVVAHPKDSVGMGFEIAASDVREDNEEFEAEASTADTREIILIVFVCTWHFYRRSFVRFVGIMMILRGDLGEEALAAHEATRAANALEAENQSQNGSDDDNGNGGDGNGENENGGNGNPDENGRCDKRVAREFTYPNSMKCQPLN
ncbi:hypothetical protein Tco_0061640, partial [Tanacetum coccineum]